MRILALDTSGPLGGIALARDGRLIEEIPLHSPDGFAHVLFDALGRLLDRHGLVPRDLDAIAAAAGPGSFTGIRVSLSAAKGLAEAWSRPAIAVSNLAALAWHGSSAMRAPLLDARRGDVYAGLFDAGLEVLSPETVGPLPALLERLPPEAELICADFTSIAAACAGRAMTHAPGSVAGAVAAIAAGRLASGEHPDPASLDANYVRRSDAEMKWTDEATAAARQAGT